MKPNRIKLRSLALLLAVVSGLTFQNCSETSDPTNGSSSSLSSNSGSGSTSSGVVLPFAYRANVDTVAYMSCDGADPTQADPNAYFTFRVGSYNNTAYGLSLTSAFQSATSGVSATQRANDLANSQDNQGAFFTLSLRLNQSLNSMISNNGVDYSSPGLAYDLFLPELDLQQVAGPLAALPPGTYLNYFPAPSGQRLMEASVRLYDGSSNGEVLVAAEGSLNSNQALLVAGYTDASKTNFLSPNDFSTSTPQNVIYGTGLQMQVTGTHTLNQVSEVDLSQVTPVPIGAAFNCPPDLRVMIVLQQDTAACPALTNPAYTPDPPVALQSPNRQLLRRILRAPYWALGVSPVTGGICATPQPTLPDSCYPAGTTSVAYNLANATCVDGTVTCPRFVSICYRQ